MERAVFFDLDGTLLDTLPDIRASLNAALGAFGYPPVDEQNTRMYIGNGAKKLIERALPAGTDVAPVLREFAALYTASDNALTRPYAGMRELLCRLKERGVRLAVITNKLQASAEKVIGTFYPGLFDFIGGDDGSFPCKPDPSLCRYAALSLRVPLRACALVGDGEPDVLTAKNAGMVPVSVLWGYRTREQLAEAGARNFVRDPSELENFLGKFCENR